MKHLILVLSLTTCIFNAESAMFSGAKVGAIPKTVVDVVITATSVTEIPTLNTAEVFEPIFRFDNDFGHGTEVLPILEQGGTKKLEKISSWICKELGYGNPIKTTGSRVQPYESAMEYAGDPEVDGETGLRIVATAKNTAVAANLVCQVKKMTKILCNVDSDCPTNHMCFFDSCLSIR